MFPEIRGRAADNLFRDEHQATDGLGTGFGRFRSYTDWDVLRKGVRKRFDSDVTDAQQMLMETVRETEIEPIVELTTPEGADQYLVEQDV